MKQRIFVVLSLPIFTILYVYTALVVLLILLFSFVKWKGGVYGIMSFWAKSVFPLIGKKLHITGKENFDRKKKYILLANHSSMFDIMAIMAFFPRVSWFGHERLLKVPIFGKMLQMTDYIPMAIANIRNTRKMLEQLVEKSDSKTIAIFPEGTRTLNGKISPFYRGFIYLLRASETDILPVTLNGFYDLKPKNRFSINFASRLEVTIHEPINGHELTSLDDKTILKRVKTVIESVSNDGLLDVCMIRKIGIAKRLNILAKVSKGTHTKDKVVNYYSTKDLEINFQKDVPFHVDGEVFHASKFDIRVFPQKFPIIFNPKGPHYLNIK